ncbi:2,3-diphosphoglycerate-dependent phosphoglycerate mutase [Parvularcula sp. LCG005]|uniref:2,3-diphosphoglycerate-dependent phosphoglycerate mutase n=1 Tax=Parvularcula sp. LCG005 TaxID=3078805 RepID=UPI002942F074|nr:2,3-diphosphoglycerate-dependent phosphoglycerate mutase [Parvularcula sp. LCG005]WOI52314.1 2,3-diphosphoglycerate-dependent phosphoglycerate mutase [Parvularcula sp. LCG005]
MPRLCLTRHGQSEWNLQNRFTGWVDVDLTPTGEEEAIRGGKLLKEAGFKPAYAFTSVQTRAIRTLNYALEGMGMLWLPVTKDWRLNERHYGGLTGLDKAETAEKHGDEQVHIWRRSYDVPPPPIEDAAKYPSLVDERYKGIETPATESLKTTLDRVAPYWESDIAPKLKHGDVIISAHGNSLRALVKLLFNVADDEITQVEIPTGNPLMIELDDNLKVVSAHYLDEKRASPLPEIK